MKSEKGLVLLCFKKSSENFRHLSVGRYLPFYFITNFVTSIRGRNTYWRPTHIFENALIQKVITYPVVFLQILSDSWKLLHWVYKIVSSTPPAVYSMLRCRTSNEQILCGRENHYDPALERWETKVRCSRLEKDIPIRMLINNWIALIRNNLF